MSALAARLPSWLAPRDTASSSRRLWRIETVVLVALGIFLAIASLNDLVWSVDDNARLVADQMTWRHYNHRDYYNVSAAPLVVGRPLDLSCANATPGPPGERTQICILMEGPIRHGLRQVVGGFMLPALTGDFARNRYRCYGAATAQHLCDKP
jgi:hypothetical protein